MKSLLYQLLRYIKRQAWGLIVAYMLGMHNFYHGDQKSPDDIVITTEQNEAQEDGTPKV
jgi:hypothetical protein